MKRIGASAIVFGAILTAPLQAVAQEAAGWSWVAKEMAVDAAKCEASDRLPGVIDNLQVPGFIDSLPVPGNIGVPTLSNPFAKNLSPLCTVSTSGGLMLLTLAFLDESSINTGLALEQAQVELVPAGLHISLAIAQMLETRTGMTHPTAALGADRDQAENSYDDVALRVVAALEEIERNGVELTPEISDALVEVSGNLARGKYYLIKSAASLYLTTQKISDEGSGVLTPGVTQTFMSESFTSRVQDRLESAASAIPNILAVERAIDSVSDRKLAKKIKEARKEAEKQAKKDVEANAERSDAAAQTVSWD